MNTRIPSRAPHYAGIQLFIAALGGGLAAERVGAQQISPPVQCGFESPDFTAGSIHGQRGWSVEQGRAEIVEGQAHSGQRALKLYPAEPFSQAKLSLAPGVPPAPVMFLDFYAIPAASDAAGQEEFLDIDGARIGLFSDAARPGEGVIHVFHGDGAGGGNWLATAAVVPLKEGSSQTSGWVQLSLREDFSRQTWDLWVNGRAAAMDVGFQDPDVGHTQNYIILGDAMESVLLDDLSIQEGNPHGPDADGDGMVDTIERSLGFNPFFDDRDADGDSDGVRNLEEALAALGHGGSPGLMNAAPERPAPPVISLASGFLDAPVAVTITGTPDGGRIRYTTDGSDPRRGPGAMTYAAAVGVNTTSVLRASAVDARGRMSDPVTAAWVFPAAVASQSQPAGTPSFFQDLPMAGTASSEFSVQWNLITGEGPGLIPASSIPPALKAAPVVVIAAGPQAFFDEQNGVYSKSSQKLTASAGLVSFGEGTPGVTADVAVSISGESSRYHDVSPKHSLRLRFAGPNVAAGILTGAAGLQGRQVVLRHPTHDSWTVGGAWAGNRSNAKYFADSFASHWLGDAGHLALQRQWVHVFLNGSYWGVYEAIEQNDADPNGITDLLEGGPGQQVDAIFGDARAWRTARVRLLELASDAATGPVSDADWTSAAAPFDLSSLIDYILINCWITNLDWPEHNYLIAKRGGLWRFVSWDAEWSLRRDDGVAVDFSQRLQTAGDGPAFVFSSLCWWPAFRAQVSARLEALAVGGGLLHPDVQAERISRAADEFRRILPAEAARWGTLVAEPGALALWEENVAWLLASYVPQRTGIITGHFSAFFTTLAAQAEAGALAARERGTPSLDPVSVPFRPGVIVIDNGGDRDGDGIPDDWEIVHGLDPRDRADGLADADGDGLSNLAEYLLGRDSGRAEPLTGVFSVEPSGVHTRSHIPRIRNGVRVGISGQPLSPDEAARAAEEDARAAAEAAASAGQ